MVKENLAKFTILGMLSCGPMSGYEIKKWADGLFGYFFVMSYGQIYPILNGLEKEKLATMTVEVSKKGPVSKVYRITDRGLEKLVAWLKGPDTGEYDTLLKFCFGSQLSYDENIKKLEAYGKKREAEIPLMEQYVQEMDGGDVYGPNTPYYRMITVLGLNYFREEVEWSKRSIKTLRELKRKENNGSK